MRKSPDIIKKDNRSLINGLKDSLRRRFVGSQILNVRSCKISGSINDVDEDLPQGSRPFIGDETPLFETSSDEVSEWWGDSNYDNGPFDLVIGDIPINLNGLHSHIWKNLNTKNSNSLSWELISQYSKLLANNGVGVFLIGPTGFFGSKGQKFIEELKQIDVFIKGYINLPRNTLSNTSIRPVLAIVGREECKLRIGELDSLLSVDDLLEELLDQTRTSKITRELPEEYVFRGFQDIEIKDKIERIESGYKDYKFIELSEFCKIRGLRTKKDKFENITNSIYIRKVNPDTGVVAELEDIEGGHFRYIQLILEENIRKEYIVVFLKSKLGGLLLKRCASSGTLSIIRVNDLLGTSFPIPNIGIQSQIVEVFDRLTYLEKQITDFKNEVSLNPESKGLLSKIDSMLEVAGSLTEGDRIKTLILQGESKSLEFKQTFQFCVRNNKKENYVEESCLKTIVGFLNTDGGTLLIGVEDSGVVLGIDKERLKLHKDSNDKFLLHLKDKIKSRIGSDFFTYIDTKIIDVSTKTVVEVECKPSVEEVFLDDKEFYIRTSPSTDKLEGKEMSSYVRKRFIK